MSKKIKAGVIGLGMGWGHLAGYSSHPGVEVIAVADMQAEKLEKAQKEFHVARTYKDGYELIKNEKLDIISVAVPNFLHKPLVIAALESGANVLCEKPMAVNAVDAEAMLAAARQSGLKLGINFSFRFTPQSRAMKSVVEAGELGDIYYARSVWMRRRGIPGMKSGFNCGGAAGSWFFNKKFAGGGPLIDLGVHRLDLALWLMGYPEVSYVLGSTYSKIAPEIARRAKVDFSVEDMACAFIKFKNGATLELDAAWAANIAENEQISTRLMGDKGGIYQYNVNEGYTFELECFRELDGKQFDCKLHPPVPEANSSYYLFAESVISGGDFLVAPEQGVVVMKILDAIYQSSQTGEPVKF